MTVKKWKGTTKNGMKSQKRNTLDRNVTTMAEQWSFIFFMHVAGTRVAISKALAQLALLVVQHQSGAVMWMDALGTQT